MPTPQREPLRRLSRTERAALRRIARSTSERVDQVRRASALLAVARTGVFLDAARERWPFLTEAQAQRMVAAYGSRLAAVLGDVKERADLGPAFGPELTAAEVRYFMTREWARFPDDILWRRSKLGLTMGPSDREALAAFMTTVM